MTAGIPPNATGVPSNALEIKRYLDILRILVERNLKLRYRGSILGIYWSLLNPLIMTAIYAAIFGQAFAAYYDNSIVSYTLAAFTGMVVINFFSTSTSQALSSVVNSSTLLNRMKLPMSAFPVSMIAANVYQLAMSTLPLLAIATLIFSGSLINVMALLLPLTGLVMICTGVGLIVSALNVFFRDLPYFYELVTFGLWISSPIFYPAEIVPDNVRRFLIFNPIAPIISSVRQIVLSGDSPDLTAMLPILPSSILLLAIGWFSFKWQKSQFMDLL
ncbi:MAG: ABC transporter permease [Cyanobacteria bacterium J06621_11]